ncbi:hypothetical protein FGO68_gene15787 [Halteria grandinella]|uniref:Uncharacterized protein n=1 Tax=Halteria grandinella TaxID=5974 RepID=A0A8J8T4Q6_HALGN|nr:hypothetical protein FGO68_gene15787 [Halteria grandinella]
MLRPTLVATALLALLSPINCWWRNGHLITARIAYDHLLLTNPAIIAKAEHLLAGLSIFTTFEGDYPFVECATFADEIKDEGFEDQSHWHYVDTPLFAEGYSAQVYPEIYNVTWSISEMVAYLSKAQSPQNDPSVSRKLGEGFNLRLLIHYVGDVHQPLHTVSRYSKEHPQNDQGGNLFELQEMEEQIDELHALWDSVVTTFSHDIIPPFSPQDWLYIGQASSNITSLYPLSSFPDIDTPHTEWAKEGYELARDYVYAGIQEGGIPTQEYLEQGKQVAWRQLAKGGYRLARLLDKMWTHKQQETVFLN